MTTTISFPAVAAAMIALGLSTCAGEDRTPVDPPDPLAITTESLPAGAVGEPYSAGVDARGGDGAYAWSVETGALPPGLTLSVDDLSDDDVLITGVPEADGTFLFTLRVDSEDGQSRTRAFSIEIVGEPAPLAIATAALPPALVGAGYDVTLAAVGGDGATFTWSVSGGGLPAGLTLDTAGRLSGTPTAADTVIVVIHVASGGFEVEKSFRLAAVSNRTGTYDLTAAPVVPIPAALQPFVDAAFARWQGVVTGDLSQASIPVGFFGDGECGGFGEVLNGTSADDLIVLLNIASIDGPGQVLGFAGPCAIRNGNDLPLAGVLTLDADDLGTMGDQELIDLIVHEIGHVLGYGSLWDLLDLLTESTSDPRFTGASAVAEWNALGGTGPVPVEDQGGEGTARAHWREAVFNRELMTGFTDQTGEQPLSRVSIASLADLGYAVNLSAADPFTLAPPMSPAAALRDRAAARGWDVVYRGTLRRIDEAGRDTTVRGGNR